MGVMAGRFWLERTSKQNCNSSLQSSWTENISIQFCQHNQYFTLNLMFCQPNWPSSDILTVGIPEWSTAIHPAEHVHSFNFVLGTYIKKSELYYKVIPQLQNMQNKMLQKHLYKFQHYKAQLLKSLTYPGIGAGAWAAFWRRNKNKRIRFTLPHTMKPR